MAAETPQNAGYMLAAYIVVPVILAGYLALLWRRVRRVERRTETRTED
jgi:CcmD family protein